MLKQNTLKMLKQNTLCVEHLCDVLLDFDCGQQTL